MPYYHIQWTPEAEDYIAQHGITAQEFEEVVFAPEEELISEASGRTAARGWTSTGKFLFCVFEVDSDGVTLIPVTAYEIGD